MADVKGGLSGLAAAGGANAKVAERPQFLIALDYAQLQPEPWLHRAGSSKS
jgi:hypothetical protein